MAITKEHKEEVLAIYQDWLKRSQAVILVEYTGARMKDMDNIRAKIRESGGEFHVVKNTLVRRVFADKGMNCRRLSRKVHGCLVRFHGSCCNRQSALRRDERYGIRQSQGRFRGGADAERRSGQSVG